MAQVSSLADVLSISIVLSNAALAKSTCKSPKSQFQNLSDSSEADGLLIPDQLVKQWERQIATPYSELTESEKESDREQVRKYLTLIVKAITKKIS